MLRIIVCVLFVFSLSSIALAQDPVKVDGNHYKVEFENAQVRVLRARLGPGEKSAMHRHPNAVAVFMTDVNGKFHFPNGPPRTSLQKQARHAGHLLSRICRKTLATSHLK